MYSMDAREAERRRLTWRCRRGMLELDIVLQKFISQKFTHLTMEEITLFDVMLEMSDNDFWTLLNAQKPSVKNQDMQVLMGKITGLQE